MESTPSTRSTSRRTRSARASRRPDSPPPARPVPGGVRRSARLKRSSSSTTSNTKQGKPKKRPKVGTQQRSGTPTASTKNPSSSSSKFLDPEWQHKFDLLCAYQRERGHCRVPKRYVVAIDAEEEEEDSSRGSVLLRLGRWVSHQRDCYQKYRTGQGPASAGITQERIDQLNSIGFPWRVVNTAQDANRWGSNFDLLCDYHREHGHCRVPRSFVVAVAGEQQKEDPPVKLGDWVHRLRMNYKTYSNSYHRTKKDNGKKQRSASLNEERIARLESIGFEWTILESNHHTSDSEWRPKFQLLRTFQRTHGHCRVPLSLMLDSVKLGEWVHQLRSHYQNYQAGKTCTAFIINEERIAQLEAIGFEWDVEETTMTTTNTTTTSDAWWQQRYQLLQTFQQEHGHCRVPPDSCVEAVKLGEWVHQLRAYYKHYQNNKKDGRHKKGDASTEERMALLEAIGFEWVVEEPAEAWLHKYNLLVAFQREHGHCRVPVSQVVEDDAIELAEWVQQLRSNYEQHKKQIGNNNMEEGSAITQEQIAQLEAIGFEWVLIDPMVERVSWRRKYNLLCAYRQQNGHCRVPQSHVTDDSVRLGEWVCHQRRFYKNYKAGKSGNGASMTEERIALLNEIGFEWVQKQRTADSDAWQHKFALLREFQVANGHCRVPASHVVDSVKLGEWVSRQRRCYRNIHSGKKGKGGTISEERIAELNSIGFEWSNNIGWEQYFELLSVFHAEKGHCRVPQVYKVGTVRLGQWACRQRKSFRKYSQGQKGKGAGITEDQMERLNSLGFELGDAVNTILVQSI